MVRSVPVILANRILWMLFSMEYLQYTGHVAEKCSNRDLSEDSMVIGTSGHRCRYRSMKKHMESAEKYSLYLCLYRAILKNEKKVVIKILTS